MLAILASVSDSFSESQVSEGRIYSNDEISASSKHTLIFLQPSINLAEDLANIEEIIPDYLDLHYFDYGKIPGRQMDVNGREICVSNAAKSILCWTEEDSSLKQLLLYGDDFVSKNEVLIDFSSSGTHICSIVADINGSKIRCLGNNSHQQLGEIGLGGTGVEGNWTHVAVGKYHSCGVKDRMDVYCWGNGNFGQLGIGKNIISSKPVLVKESNREIVQLESGTYHSCTLDKAGFIDCWGSNSFGQIGDGFVGSSGYVSLGVEPGKIESIILTENSTCGIKKSIVGMVCFGWALDPEFKSGDLIEGPSHEVDFETGIDNYRINPHGKCEFYTNGSIGCSKFQTPLDRVNFDGSYFTDIYPTLEGFCGIRHDGRLECISDGEVPYRYPQGYRSIRVVEELLVGTIYGFAEEDRTDTVSISLNSHQSPQRINIVISIEGDSDNDDWGDNVEEQCNTNPFDRLDYPPDYDFDTICDRLDHDADGDGVVNSFDKFPLDSMEWKDDDGDGIGSNADSIEISPGLMSSSRVFAILSSLLLLEFLRRATKEGAESIFN